MLLILQHDSWVPPGYLMDAIDAVGADVTVVHLWDGEPVPGHEGWEGIVSLGGSMGAYNEDSHPWIVPEKAMLRAAVSANVPLLGICLGCQLLADALGGSAFKAPDIEVFFDRVTLTADGMSDVVVGQLTEPTLVWHQDTWQPPTGSTLLAESDRYPQAFRFGSAIGIQPHPETSPEQAAKWAATPEGAEMLERAVVTPDQLVTAMRSNHPEPMARRVFTAWLDGALGTPSPS